MSLVETLIISLTGAAGILVFSDLIGYWNMLVLASRRKCRVK